MKIHTKALLAAVSTFSICGSATAATIFTNADGANSNIRNNAGNWDNGLPSSTNPGTISIDGTWRNSNAFEWGGGTVVINHTAGTITFPDEFNFRTTGYVWNMSGGLFDSPRFVLANQSTINFSGGLVQSDTFIGVGNNGTINVSGTAVLEEVDGNREQGGTFNFDSGWTGSWTATSLSGTDWRTYILSEVGFKLNGAAIDGTTFDNNFVISNGGQTLALVPEPGSLALLGLGGLCVLRRRRV